MIKKTTCFLIGLLTAVAAIADDWSLVTNVSQLEPGDSIIFACNTKAATAASITTGTTYMASVSSTFSADKSTITSVNGSTIRFILGGQSGAWTFTTTSGKLLGATAAKTLKFDSGTTTWTIAISNGTATVTNGTSSYGALLYNSSSPRFTTYTSGQTAIQLYRKPGVPTVTYTFCYEGYPFKKTNCSADSVRYEAGKTVTLSTGSPVKDGDVFLGWSYNGAVYQPGEQFVMPEENVALVALWQSVPAALNENTTAQKAQKLLRDGKLFIRVGEHIYNAQGKLVE